ncbi:MAG: hypothetical protein M1812_004905 [Candelaria pacifica]|nr:MAG: hypothetical protein M1812_004905 [Candelaria pacifica]
MSISREDLEFIINHVILLPKLPETEDSNLQRGEEALLQLVHMNLRSFIRKSPVDHARLWGPAFRMISTWRSCIGRNGTISLKHLVNALGELREGESIALCIHEQNAGLLIQQETETQVVFSAFEASPLSDKITETKARLVRTFPGCCVRLNVELLQNEDFRVRIARSLQQMDGERVGLCLPTTKKAGDTNVEVRETASPMLVTDLLMSLLAALGELVERPPLVKHTRDEVLYRATLKPWRRCPCWIVIKVALQLALEHQFADQSTMQYKNFMLFLVSSISNQAIDLQMAPEIQQIVGAKLARRAHKLGAETSDFVASMALRAAKDTRAHLDSIWISTQNSEKVSIPSLEYESIEKYLSQTLANSKAHLREAMNRVSEKCEPLVFEPEPTQRKRYTTSRLPLHGSLSTGDALINLADLEQWVKASLDTWVARKSKTEEDCTSLASLIRSYVDLGLETYRTSPREVSNMLLTVLELWIALDQICTGLYPLLSQYSPEITTDLLEHLLLPNLDQMQRLRSIETYLKNRHTAALRKPSIFADPQYQSFASQFYESSVKHQQLRAKIEEDARWQRQQKEVEWNELQDRHGSLIQRVDSITCTYDDDDDEDGQPIHYRFCERCRLVFAASNMSIGLDEWPLPRDEATLKSVVFELDCPQAFVAWRDSTWFIVQNLGRRNIPKRKAKMPDQELLTYKLLSRYVADKQQVVTLGSSTKSFLKSHYSSCKIPTELDKVCVNNALQFHMWDISNSLWLAQQDSPPSLAAMCITPLPDGPYSMLQFAVDSYVHDQNQVISKQGDCPPTLTLHEFISFGTLRAGEHLQWLNILRELGSSNLTLNNEAVLTLILQASWQAGPPLPDNELRAAHSIFSGGKFEPKLLEMLQRIISAIEGNWKEQNTMFIPVALSLRIVALSQVQSTRQHAISLLQNARDITVRWCTELTALLHNTTDERGVENFRRLLLRAGSICLMTYDIDKRYVDHVLRTEHDVAILVDCLILLYDNAPSSLQHLPQDLQRHLLLNRKIAHRLEEPIRGLVELGRDGQAGLSRAVGGMLNGVIFAHTWSYLKSNLRWAVNSTAKTVHRSSQTIHLDLLTGRLLIDGKPLGRVPQEYSNHNLYQRIFGSRVLQVLTSHMPSMSYMTSRTISDQQVHLELKKDEQLIVRTIHNGDVLEVVPHHHFSGDFPSHFVDDYVHWLNLGNGVLEFRPLQTLWQTSTTNWRLLFDELNGSSMRFGHRQMFDFRSHISNRIVKVLEVLEHKANIHVTLDENGTIVAELPRYRLKFFVNASGQLESKELAAIVDRNQDLGTLFGLKNKLVLRNGSASQSVLIPFGHVSITKAWEHVRIEIAIGEEAKVRYFQYHIDPQLRKLRHPQGLLGPLYKAYLHAITSWILEDPFTARTGIEEALTILREESLRTFLPLDNDVMQVLSWISSLTPSRTLYPAHLRKMQQVEWSQDLGQLAQHDEFDVLARSIADHAARFAFLHHNVANPVPLPSRGDVDLLIRARVRNSALRSHEFGGEVLSLQADQVYYGRDRAGASARARRVYDVVSLIRSWPQTVDVELNLESRLDSWGLISGYGQLVGLESYTDLTGLSFGRRWGSLYDICRQSKRDADSYKLMFLFGPVAFGHDEPDMVIIRTLLAFAFSDRFRQLSAPAFSAFNLARGALPKEKEVKNAIRTHFLPLPENHRRSRRASDERRRLARLNQHNKDVAAQVDTCTDFFLEYWPGDDPKLPQAYTVPFIKVAPALEACSKLYQEWYRNKLFKDHVNLVVTQLQSIHCEGKISTLLPKHTPDPEVKPVKLLPSLLDLLTLKVPKALQSMIRETPSALSARRGSTSSLYSEDQNELRNIIVRLQNHPNVTRQEYGNDLYRSLIAFEQNHVPETPQKIPFTVDDLLKHTKQLEVHVSKVLGGIHRCLRPLSVVSEVLHVSGLSPRITSHSLLSLLSSSHISQLNSNWKQILIAYGESINRLQRSKRLLHLARRNNILGFFKEAESTGREGWNPSSYPDWLLMEVENDFTIRPLQARVALEMISPSSDANSVLQLNMGEGKSSVIMPMVAAVLANKRQLVRVVVLKPLLRQTDHLLAQRLGGLVNRRIYHTQFSRQTDLNLNVVNSLHSIYEECKAVGGVLLTLPEHMLSFRLMGRERLSFDQGLAGALMDTEHWLQLNSRLVLDESDEILDTRFQLVYTVGGQQLLDGQPERWTIAQEILSLVDKQATVLQEQCPDGLEIDRRASLFPVIRLLQPALGDTLMSRVLNDVGEGYLKGISFTYCPQRVRKAALRFIGDRVVSGDDISLINNTFAESNNMGKLLILRGLFAHQILKFALFKKRWLVEYGLDSRRCQMAVPYKAKGVPSLSAEFGHPEVAISLTCLSYYYTGLESGQLRRCFDILLTEPDPSHEYHVWCTAGDSLPKRLQTLNGVNLEDETMWRQEVFPRLRYSKGAIDFFMSNVVFPREGKEFLKKLSTSSWDIPTTSDAGLATGFSGTNDNRFLLPLSIEQHDLADLHPTNAMVLNTILQQENRRYMCAKDKAGRRCSVVSFLQLMSEQSPSIQVLIDVGALVLDKQNYEVATEWLKLVPSAKAAVYFDEQDEMMVVDREGYIDRLVASPFCDLTEDCLVYLDEVHTRGIDLDLPISARAAVTLGPRLIKDRLVQACCRMRKLGNGQSLAFFSTPDVHRSIQGLGEKSKNNLDCSDVIQWALEQTCQGTEQTKPLWAMQGFEYSRRTQSCSKLLEGTNSIHEAIEDEIRVSQFWENIQEPEAQTLTAMYGATNSPLDPLLSFTTEERQDPVVKRLGAVWSNMDTSELQDCLVHEEQEREVAHEIEREREVQRPLPMDPCAHKLHPDVIYFVDHGVVPTKNAGIIEAAFSSLGNTSVMQNLQGTDFVICPGLGVTKDFSLTVEHQMELRGDDFIRPVHWVLSSAKSNFLLIISPYEANQLLQRIKSSKVVRLHVYAPCTSKTMVSFADLRFHTVSACNATHSWPVKSALRDLHLFSGGLYFDNYKQYEKLCDYLAIVTDRSRFDEREDLHLGSDGFANAKARKALNWPIGNAPWRNSPLPFVKALLAMRRKDQNFSQSHMGDLVQGRILKEESFR